MSASNYEAVLASVIKKIDIILIDLNFTTRLNQYCVVRNSILNEENGGRYHIRCLMQISIEHMTKVAAEILNEIENVPSIRRDNICAWVYQKYQHKYAERLVFENQTVEKLFEKGYRYLLKSKKGGIFNISQQSQRNLNAPTVNTTRNGIPNSFQQISTPLANYVQMSRPVNASMNAVSQSQSQMSRFVKVQNSNGPVRVVALTTIPSKNNINAQNQTYRAQMTFTACPLPQQHQQQSFVIRTNSINNNDNQCLPNQAQNIIKQIVSTNSPIPLARSVTTPKTPISLDRVLLPQNATQAVTTTQATSPIVKLTKCQENVVQSNSKRINFKIINSNNQTATRISNAEIISSTCEPIFESTNKKMENEIDSLQAVSQMSNTNISGTTQMDSIETTGSHTPSPSLSLAPLENVSNALDMPSLDLDDFNETLFTVKTGPKKHTANDDVNEHVSNKKLKVNETVTSENDTENVAFVNTDANNVHFGESNDVQIPINQIKVEKDIETEVEDKEIREKVIRYIEINSDDDSDDDVIIVSEAIDEAKEQKFVSKCNYMI